MAADRFVGIARFSVFALLALTTGCAGARSELTADDARYPVSLSRGVRDAEGDLVSQDRMKTVGTFHDDTTVYGFVYSLAKVTPKVDISRVVNEQVAAHGGDAIVNLRVNVKSCALDYIPFIAWVPGWPGCAKVDVRGDIIKVAAAEVQP